MNRALAIFLGLATLAFMIFALFPIEVVVAPSAKLTVVAPDGKPVSGALVRQIWQHYSVERQSHEQDLTTDRRGEVQLPVRTIRVSRLGRLVGNIRNRVETGVHASYGPHSSVLIWSNELEGELDLAAPVPPRIVLRRSRA